MNNQTQKHLDAIFHSKEFVNSESSKRLLTYLVERSLENHVPKETDIAITVFGRDASYDPSSDSLVRSHIYALRNKLEKYYLTRGKFDKIRLIIPKGHYKVEFQAVPSGHRRSASSQRTAVLSISGIVLIGLMLFLVLDHFFVLKSQSTRMSNEQLPDFPWAAIKASKKPVLFVIGDFFVYVHRKSDEYGNRRIRDGNVNSFQELMDYYEKYPQEKQDFTGLTHTYVNPSVTEAAMTLIPSFTKSAINIEFKHASQLEKKDIEKYNIVFVGPLKTLRLLTPYFNMSGFEFDFYPHTLTFEEKSDTTNLKTLNAEIEDGLQYRKDYGFVVQAPGPADNIIMIITAFSTTSLPTLTQILHSGEFQRMAESAEHKPFPPYFKSLFQVDIISDTDVYTLLKLTELKSDKAS